jgi:hypothetical protein
VLRLWRIEIIYHSILFLLIFMRDFTVTVLFLCLVLLTKFSFSSMLTFWLVLFRLRLSFFAISVMLSAFSLQDSRISILVSELSADALFFMFFMLFFIIS